VTDYVYSKVAVYAELGGTVRLARNSRSFATDPVTAVPINITQGAFTAAYLDTDSSGIADFTATTPGPIRLTTGATFVDVYSEQLPGDLLAASASASASAASAAASAALVGAPADSAVAAIMGSSASASRVVTDGIYLPGVAAVGAGIDPTGVADSTAAIQAKIDAVGVAGGIVYVPTGTYSVTGLLLPSGVTLQGGNAGGQVGGPSKLVYAGTAGGTVIGPKVRASDTINVGIIGLSVNGGGLAALGIDLYRTSYSRLRDCAVFGIQLGGVGVLFDSNVSNQCYFNTADGMKLDGSVATMTGVRFQHGANVNRWSGGAMISVATGMEFLSLSAGNTVIGTDFETATVKHVYVDAASNVFIGLHMEGAPIGYDITTNGSNTVRLGTSFASTCLIPEQVAASGHIQQEVFPDGSMRWSTGFWKMVGIMLSGSTNWELDAKPFSGTANSIFRFFRNTTTTGLRRIEVYKGDGTTNTSFIFDAATGDITTLSGKIINGGYGYTETVALAAPTTGAQVVGSRVRNRAPAVGSPKAWVCTVAGTPGTWVSEGNL